MKRFLVLVIMLVVGCLTIPDNDDCITAAPKQKPALIGGRPANPADWPASVYISANGARCSATLIGERTLLSAAHCMKDGATVTFNVGPNRHTAKCKHHQDYASDKTADWALCLVNRVVSGVPFETVLTEQGIVKNRATMLLTGYGCTEKGGTGGNDGVFRIGEAKVSRLPQSNHDTVLGSGAALCFGDSGGAGYVFSGDKRRLFGVNSRGNIATTSYLASTFTGAFASFATSWALVSNTKICGIHSDATGCRATAPKPEPTPTGSPDPCKPG